MRKITHLVLALSALLLFQSCGQDRRAKNYNSNSQTQVDDDGLRFVMDAVAAGQKEIEASIAAKNISKNPRVLNFAKMMITQHSDVLEKLRKIQSDKFITPDDTLSMEKQKVIAGLSDKSGVEFDRSYINIMVNDHKEAVKLFKGATSNRTKAIKDLAKQTLPKIKTHLDSAKAIQAALK